MPPKTNPVRNDPAVLGPCDEIEHGLPILCFKDEAGKPVGALISFACHHDTIGGTKISGDYSCILGKELKKVYGPDFICVFVPGASGNINHYDISKPEEPADHYSSWSKRLPRRLYV